MNASKISENEEPKEDRLDEVSEEFLEALADAVVDILWKKHRLTILKKGVNNG